MKYHKSIIKDTMSAYKQNNIDFLILLSQPKHYEHLPKQNILQLI